MPGRVQSIGAGPGRRGLVGAAKLDARIPRVRVCVGIAQVAVQKKIMFMFGFFLEDMAASNQRTTTMNTCTHARMPLR